jgi:hypothetical protein
MLGDLQFVAIAMDHVKLPHRSVAVESQVGAESSFTVRKRVDNGQLVQEPLSRVRMRQQRFDQEPLVRIMPADVSPCHSGVRAR